MNTSGFYKYFENEMFYGPNFVLNSSFQLRKETKDQNTYPVDGWYWFDDEDSAYAFFGIEKPVPPEEQQGI